MKTWFFLDLLSSLPVDYIFLILDSGLLETNLVKPLLFRQTNLEGFYKLFKFGQICPSIQDFTSSSKLVKFSLPSSLNDLFLKA